MSVAHTPVRHGPGWSYVNVTLPDGRAVTIQVDRLSSDAGHSESDRIVREFAAAPALLAALEALLHWQETSPESMADRIAYGDSVRAARSALSKAKGGAS